MVVFLIRRLLLMVPVMAGVTAIAFSLLLLLPGDPALAILGEQNSQNKELYQTLRQELGLDRPIPIQYLSWVGRALRGDLGSSAYNRQAVGALIQNSLPPTLQLAAMAMAIALLIALPVGIVSAARPDSWIDRIGTVLALSGIAIPSFWLAILLIFALALKLRLLPPSGYVSPTQDLAQSLRLMAMPSFVLGVELAAVLTRQIRSAMLEVLHQDYVTTARAKGLSERGVLLKHALRNALIPVVTVIGVQTGRLFGGAVVIETMFSIPGMGRLAVTSIFFRDFPVVQGVVLVLAVAVLASNLVADVLYGLIDPRIRYA